MSTKERKSKIELIKRIAEGELSIYDFQPWIFIVQKDVNKYLSEGKAIGWEVTDRELDLIKVPKIYIDQQDLCL